MRFGQHIAAARQAGELVVQPRMGFDHPTKMRLGLQAVRDASARVVGTITLDSYTRVGDLASTVQALREGKELNGYPIVSHGTKRTREMLEGIQANNFPIQVRHGSPLPEHIFASVLACGIDATEGGPISYCLPYGRTPLREAISSWRRCADLAATSAANGHVLHIETFGGCMLGQMCPPSMLVAISVLESLFFIQRGVPSVSLSYAQQTSFEQDVAAIRALRHLAARWLPNTDWHIVLYTYMGVFPRTEDGARDLLRQSVHIALRGGAERLIVKTVAEAHRIPTIEENVQALELAAQHWRNLQAEDKNTGYCELAHYETVLSEATTLIESVLSLHNDVGEHIYFSACIRNRFGNEAAERFKSDHVRIRNPNQKIALSLLKSYDIEDISEINLTALVRPFENISFSNPEDFRYVWRDYLKKDLQEAITGNVDSPIKAALDVLRDVRDTLRSVVEFEGLNEDSLINSFRCNFSPMCALLAAGPPAVRIEQLLALEAAGILSIVGPSVTVDLDITHDHFQISSPQVPGQVHEVTQLIDSRIPTPSLTQSRSLLLQAMMKRGLIKPYKHPDHKGLCDGGIDVLPESFEVVNIKGCANSRIFAIGLPTELPRWFTQVGSATPGTKSRFTLDAQAVANGTLAALSQPYQSMEMLESEGVES